MFVPQATHFISTLRIARGGCFHCSFRTAAFDVARRMAVVTRMFPAAPIGDRRDWGSIESVGWVERWFVCVTVTSRAKGRLDSFCRFNDF